MDSGYTYSFQPLSTSLGASYIRGWVDLENVKKLKFCFIYITEFASLLMLKINISPIDRPQLNRFHPYIFSRTSAYLFLEN